MILLYGLVIFLLGVGAFITGRRARSLERRYMRVANEADQIAMEMGYRGGNCSVPDQYATAKRQYELGALVHVRDRLEAKFDVWEGRASRFRRMKRRMLECKGRFVPYALGIVDVAGVVALLAVAGIVDPNQLRSVIDTGRKLVLK
jgi:hypothetical protein